MIVSGHFKTKIKLIFAAKTILGPCKGPRSISYALHCHLFLKIEYAVRQARIQTSVGSHASFVEPISCIKLLPLHLP